MILDKYVIRRFIPVFFVALSMFVLLLLLIDLFANLWRYLAYDAAIKDIALVAFYYIPKCISYALPVSLLFAVAFVFGEFYARNELTIVFTSGIPVWRFAAPLLVLGLLLSFGSFFFEDLLVISSLKKKNQLASVLLRQEQGGNNSDVVVKTDGGKLLYVVDYYNEEEQTLNGLSIVLRDENGRFISLIRSRQASWEQEEWILQSPATYQWEAGYLIHSNQVLRKTFTENPDTFRRNAIAVEELSASQAALFIEDLKNAGLPYFGALADYHRRFAFSATSFIVIILSIAIGGRFRKNILLMSLLSSLISAVIYYVAQMISMMMAKLGYIPPLTGAWMPVYIFIILGLVLMRYART